MSTVLEFSHREFRTFVADATGAQSVLPVCSGQPIPDSGLSFSSATAGGSPSLN